jgi:hypothetical protein
MVGSILSQQMDVWEVRLHISLAVSLRIAGLL